MKDEVDNETAGEGGSGQGCEPSENKAAFADGGPGKGDANHQVDAAKKVGESFNHSARTAE